MAAAKYRLDTEHGRCTSISGVKREITAVALRNGGLRLNPYRFGQTKPHTLGLVPVMIAGPPSARETTRVRYRRLLERVLVRRFQEWTID